VSDDASPLGTQTIALVRDPSSNASALACVVKRSYAIGAGGRLSLADEQVPLLADPELLIDEHDSYARLLDDTDLAYPKQATDVVLRGLAHSKDRTRELYVALAVGSNARRLRVSGERTAEVRADGTVRFSSAEPFESSPIAYDVAYGGYDDHAHFALHPPTEEEVNRLGRPVGLFAYPRNSAGRAYFVDVDRRRADGARLPLVEDPSDPLVPERFFVPRATAWIDAPIPGALGWLHHAWYPRFVRFVGPLLAHDPPAHPPREIALGEVDLADPAELDVGVLHPRALQGAAPGLSRERLRGDELVILSNLHPTIADLRFELPGEAPRMVMRPPDVKAFTPKPVLQTVRLEPEDGLVVLTWCGVVPILSRVDEAFLSRCELGVSWARR
jgi:hypothetical protein